MNPTTPFNPCFLWVVTLLTKYALSAGTLRVRVS